MSSLHLVLQQMGKDVTPEEGGWELRNCEVGGGRKVSSKHASASEDGRDSLPCLHTAEVILAQFARKHNKPLSLPLPLPSNSPSPSPTILNVWRKSSSPSVTRTKTSSLPHPCYSPSPLPYHL